MPSPEQPIAVPVSVAGASAGRLDTNVRSFMRSGVITVPESASMKQVQRALVAHRVHAVLVVSVRTGEPIGWATARGVIDRMLSHATVLPAALAITEPVESISPRATGEDALRRFVETGCARLLVHRNLGSPPEGVVSEMDLVQLTA